MQQVPTHISESIDSDVNLGIYSEVIFEAELNATHEYTVTSSASVNDNMFPANEVTRSSRPKTGLPKLIVNSGRLTSTDISYPAGGVYQKSVNRYRVPSESAKYKYFRTQSLCSAIETVAGYEFDETQSVSIEYDDIVRPNKIVVGFEISSASPSNVNVQIKNPGGNWHSIGVYSPDSDGLVSLYYDGDEWSESYSEGVAGEPMRGVRILVSAMDTASSALEVIQISPRYIENISDRVINSDVSKTREEISLVSPIGVSSASVGGVQIDNTDGYFSKGNEYISTIIDINNKINISFRVETSGGNYVIPQISGYVDEWSFDSEGVISCNITDYSKFLQNTTIENTFYENKNMIFIVSDIVERVGITDYKIKYSEADFAQTIPYVFFTDENTVWDALTQIASAEQAVFYFDELGTFVWESRDYLWEQEDVDYEIRSNNGHGKLANMISAAVSHEIVANKSTVLYYPTDRLSRGGKLINNFLWEYDGELILPASALQETITLNSEHIKIEEEDYGSFEKEGIVNIDAEYIRYTKELPEGFTQTDNALYILERGVFDSIPSPHNFDIDETEWTQDTISKELVYNESNEIVSSTLSFSSAPNIDGYVEITNSKAILHSLGNENNITRYYTGSLSDSFGVYGCELLFPANSTTEYYDGEGIAGMFIQSDGQDSGYYFEVLLSEYAYLDQQVKREVRVWKFDESGNREILVGYYPADLTSFSEEELLQITGADTVIIPEKSYKLTISRTDLGFLFIVNGKNVLWLEDETIKNGKWGVFTRANTVAEFEYVYAIDRGSDSTALSEAQIAIRDQLTGGYNDNTLDYFLSQNSGIVQDFRFDDFGSWVRAAKELDVVHDIFPSITSRLFVANSTSVYTIYNNHTQFSSEFAIANRKREYAVVSGDDQNINASMVLAVYGVPIKQDEPSDVKRLNERSIWRRGEEEIIVDSTFIQSEEHAERISDWIVERWSSPIKIVAVESIVDPRIQLGDVASIDFSDLNFSPEANRFHVIDVSTSVGASMSMSVTLRKIS